MPSQNKRTCPVFSPVFSPYGATLDDSDIARSDLLRAEIYPDSDDVGDTGVPPVLSDGTDNTYDRIEYTYNRQGQRLSMKDQNGSVHEFAYDDLGRQLHDRITTLGSGVDGSIRRLSTTYEMRGQMEKATSYDNATVGSGSAINEVLREPCSCINIAVETRITACFATVSMH